MQKPYVNRSGGVLSADIAVPDHERELAFYSTILTTGTAPLWRADLMNNLGNPVIGLGARTPQYEALPLQWMPHIQVAARVGVDHLELGAARVADDLAASAASAIDMGGRELMHGKDDNGQSQWAVLTDQYGAAFGVIPVVDEELESRGRNERIGCISWLSLTVPDASASRDFYQQVVGWNARPIENQNAACDGADFEMRIDNETAAAEIRQFRREQNGIPSVWLIHLPVDDLSESLRRVQAGGGEVIQEFAEAKWAVIRDPVGVYLALQAQRPTN